jgi:amino acid transporter
LTAEALPAAGQPTLRRTLRLWDLIFYGIVIIQPTAPMSSFGVVSVEARGHVVTTILIGLVGMLLTAVSYGRMARAYPSAGSAFTYVGQSIHPALGYVTGWSMVMDYVLNPLICTIYSTSLTIGYFPWLPRPLGCVFFAVLFTVLNLQGVKTSAPRTRSWASAWEAWSCCSSAPPSATSWVHRSRQPTSRGPSTIRRRSPSQWS